MTGKKRQRNFKCSECKVVCKSQNSLQKHQAVHSEQVQDSRKDCEDKYQNEQDLGKSITGTRPETKTKGALTKSTKLKGSFPCEKCGKVLKTPTGRHYHMLSHNEDKPYVCEECGKGFVFIKRLQQHAYVHKEEKPFNCDICNKGFGNLANLKRHRYVHTGERPFSCSQCEKTYTSAGSLKVHAARHIKENFKFKCTECSETFEYNKMLLEHLATNHVGAKPHICPECGENFATKAKLRTHRFKHKGKTHICSECGKGFICLGKLRKHMASHTGIKPLLCPICGKGFVSGFEDHMRSHTDERPYQCPECGQRYNNKYYLKKHIDTVHRNIRNFTCEKCGRTFKTNSHWNIHMRSHTNTKPHVCSYCSKAFLTSGKLGRHIVQHTGERPFRCLVCDRTFTQTSPLFTHIRKDHPEKIPELSSRSGRSQLFMATSTKSPRTDHLLQWSATSKKATDPLAGTKGSAAVATVSTSSDPDNTPNHLYPETSNLIGYLNMHENLDSETLLVKESKEEFSDETNKVGENVSKFKRNERQNKKEVSCYVPSVDNITSELEDENDCEAESNFLSQGDNNTEMGHLDADDQSETNADTCEETKSEQKLQITNQPDEKSLDLVSLKEVEFREISPIISRQRRTCTKAYLSYQSSDHAESSCEESECDQDDVICPVCFKVFSVPSMLAKHKLIHGPRKPPPQRYVCSFCSKGFPYKNLLADHITVHSKDKPFKCDVCGLKYKTKKSLQDHVLFKHRENNPFVCEHCGIAYHRHTKLKHHLKVVHSSERQYLCVECGKGFKQKGALDHHMLFHRERTQVCPHCNKAFYTERHLKRHMVAHTGERPWKCLLCSRTFTQSGPLYKHVRNDHPEMIPELSTNAGRHKVAARTKSSELDSGIV